MKTRTILIIAALSVSALVVFTGCITPNPPVITQGPNGPVTNLANPPYGIDPRLAAASNTVSNVAGAIAPVNPYAGITDLAYKSIFAIIGAATTYALQRKNGVALNQLAASVAAQPQTVSQAILDHASNNESIYPVIAGIVNSKMPST